MKHQHLATDVLGVGRGQRVQAAVEAHDASTAVGDLLHHGAAEAVADGTLNGQEWVL